MVKQRGYTKMRDEAAVHGFALACACCRWPASPSRDGAVRAAAAKVTDWAGFLRVVDRQRIAGLACQALTAAGVALPPRESRALAERANRIARQNLAMAAEAVRLQTLFEAASIPVLWLKGVSLAQAVYGSVALKHGKDLDLFVPPGRARAAARLLQENGYELEPLAGTLSRAQRDELFRYGWEVALSGRRGGAEIELHWRLTGNPCLLTGLDPLSSRRRVMLAGDRGVDVLGDDELFLYLCVHGASHLWMRLKWLADLNALLAGKCESELVRLFRRAEDCGAAFCAGQGLLLCQALLDLNLPPELQERICRRGRTALLVSSAIDAMVGNDAQTEVIDRSFGTTRMAVAKLRLGSSWRFYAAQCALLLFCVEDVVRFALPGRLRFLGPVYYPLIRLPLWLWRHASRFRSKAAPLERGMAGEPR